MTELASRIARLQRPSLLVRAARHGLGEYSRSRDLQRILRGRTAPGPALALAELVEEEEHLETIRQAGDASYSFIRHIEVLIAMLGEMRLLEPGTTG